MDPQKLHKNLQDLKEQLTKLMNLSAELIERNSQIDDGVSSDNLNPLPSFELMLEDFLGSCNMIELNLRTMQECLILGKASVQNLPITVSNLKADLDNRVETIEPNSTISYNQYQSVIRYQVDTAKAIRTILENCVKEQQSRQQNQQQQQQNLQEMSV